MNLISMTELILTNDYKENIQSDSELIQLFRNYANLLRQELTISMFVPCDEDGKPYEELKPPFFQNKNGIITSLHDDFQSPLFKLFQINWEDNKQLIFEDFILDIVDFGGSFALTDYTHTFLTVEHLIGSIYCPELTKTALKQIGL